MQTKKALVVGIDYYKKCPPLRGCVNDAVSVNKILARNEDNSLNFTIQALCARDACSAITKKNLKDAVTELFKGDTDIALFYFSGHGYVENDIGYLITSEVETGDDGFSMDELLKIVNESKVKNKVIVLDCCHAGMAGTLAAVSNKSILSEGSTFLAASTKDESAKEKGGHGIFTALFVDALGGAAANLVGDITPGSIYAHIDQALGPWDQSPVFKTNVKSFISLRKVNPPIELANLQKITALFPAPDYQFALDPSFEPEQTGRPEGAIPPNPDNTKKFAVLQKYNRINLLVPVDAPHMWHAAIQSKSCKLTALGQYYWSLVAAGRL